MKTKQLIILIPVLMVLLGSGWKLWTHFRGNGQPYNPRPMEVLGVQLGEETARSLNGSGKIAVIGADPDTTQDPAKEALWSGFNHALTAYPQIEMVGVYSPDLEPEDDGVNPSMVQPIIQKALAQFSTVDAVVSFIGLPASVEHSPPPLLMGYHEFSDTRWAWLLDTGTLAWAITPNWGCIWESPQAVATDEELFDLHFLLYSQPK